MKRMITALLAIALAVSAAGCGRAGGSAAQTATRTGEGNGRLSVVSTIFPGYDFARAVAGENVSLTMLLPPGSESHSFEPTPKDILTIQNCDLFIYVGGESDAWVKGILDSMDTSGMTILPMMELVDAVEEEIKEGMQHEHDEEHEHSEEGEYDEHVWTSPVNAMRISGAIADALCALDEANADAYRANSEAFHEQLSELDSSFREVVQNASRKTMVFGDRFPFRYFVDEYGLDYYAAFPGCAADTEADAKTVAFLIDKVKAEQIPAVFHIEFSNEKMADTICEGSGAKKLLFHSCHNVTRDQLAGGVTYLELMADNVESLREALT